MMVVFVSLFLGLTSGIRLVEVAVADPVAQVDLYLDGREAGSITGEPWEKEVDLGDDLEPHLLVAVARGWDGRMLDRAQQWINMPRPLAEAEILLEGSNGQRPTRARLLWASASHKTLENVSFRFDGRPVPVTDPKSITLPHYDPQEVHFVAAELLFAQGISTRAEAVFGGTFGDTLSTEVQAVTLTLEVGSPLPGVKGLAEWINDDGSPLRVRAVDSGPADIVMVVDLATQDLLRKLMRSNQDVQSVMRRQAAGDPQRTSFVVSRVPVYEGLDEGDRFFFVTPTPQQGPQEEDAYTLFPVSPSFTQEQGSLFEILARARMPLEAWPSQRLADAVAVAGIRAFTSGRPRQVVLLVGDDPLDNSRWTLAQVRHYLSCLQVPFSVWSIRELGLKKKKRKDNEQMGVDGPRLELSELGDKLEISTIKGLNQAIQLLRDELDSQHVFWVQGHHLPQNVRMGSDIRDAAVAGRL